MPYTVDEALRVVRDRLERVALRKLAPLRGWRLRRLLAWREVLLLLK